MVRGPRAAYRGLHEAVYEELDGDLLEVAVSALVAELCVTAVAVLAGARESKAPIRWAAGEELIPAESGARFGWGTQRGPHGA